jgi:anti-sigma factor RsiW
MSDATGCIGTPISWLRLERYRLGEISADEKKDIADHVGACAACAASLARIESDDAAPLAPLL